MGGKERIPRLPWADATDSSGESEDVVEEDDWVEETSYPRLDEQPNQAMGGGWDPFEMNEEGESAYWNGENGEQSSENELAGTLAGPPGLGGMGAYSMTPFDVLYSVFAGSDVSAAVLEEALVLTGWDVDAAIERTCISLWLSRRVVLNLSLLDAQTSSTLSPTPVVPFPPSPPAHPVPRPSSPEWSVRAVLDRSLSREIRSTGT